MKNLNTIVSFFRPLQGLFILSVVITSATACAQEVERDLPGNPFVRKAMEDRPSDGFGSRGGGNLLLPFFDDFSRYSLPSDDPDLLPEWQLWSDTMAYLNTTLPVSPPTIGVATLDGLNARGYPYDFTDEYAYGPADTLTSLPINLAGYSAEDHIYLTFLYQPGGIGNAPDEEDSLVVEFYSPFGAGQWFHEWSVPGTPSAGFQQVFLAIDAPEYLLDGFRFRFRNYATLSGAFDHWHIDYVIVREGIDPDNFEFDEVAMQYAGSTLLEEYTAMPWTHFISDASSFMVSSLSAQERNLGPTENIVTGYSISYEGLVTDFPDQDFNTFGNGFQEFTRNLDLDGFVYDTSVNDSCAAFDVRVYISPTDLNLQNDTAQFTQMFSNYYAYDDGSAERAYAVEAPGASVAVKYKAEVADTLLGLLIHWIPYGVNVVDQNFLMRVWGDAGGEPGSELIENFIFHAPRFYEDGYNLFSYYPFDQPVFVEDNFYVGWTQPNAIGLNVGNDKNSDANPVKLFYRLGTGQVWQQSAIEGAVMIRPVFRAGKDEVWTGVSDLSLTGVNVFPVPAQDQLNVTLQTKELVSARLFDLAGRLVMEKNLNGSGLHSMDITSLSGGSYVLVLRETGSGRVYRQTIIRQ